MMLAYVCVCPVRTEPPPTHTHTHMHVHSTYLPPIQGRPCSTTISVTTPLAQANSLIIHDRNFPKDPSTIQWKYP